MKGKKHKKKKKNKEKERNDTQLQACITYQMQSNNIFPLSSKDAILHHESNYKVPNRIVMQKESVKADSQRI